MIQIHDLKGFDGLVIPRTSGLGNHLLVDAIRCQRLPQQAGELEKVMLEVAERVGATVVTSTFHQFNPVGLSGVVVIAESHLAVHTWPEHGSACIDLFTCSSEMDPLPGLRYLFEAFQPSLMTLLNQCRAPLD